MEHLAPGDLQFDQSGKRSAFACCVSMKEEYQTLCDLSSAFMGSFLRQAQVFRSDFEQGWYI